MTCPMKEIGSGAEHCPYDWLAIHDGRDENAPIIGQFCGMGKFPFSIIGNFSISVRIFGQLFTLFPFCRNIPAHVRGVRFVASWAPAQQWLSLQRRKLAGPCRTGWSEERAVRLAFEFDRLETNKCLGRNIFERGALVPAKHVLQLSHSRRRERNRSTLFPKVSWIIGFARPNSSKADRRRESSKFVLTFPPETSSS